MEQFHIKSFYILAGLTFSPIVNRERCLSYWNVNLFGFLKWFLDNLDHLFKSSTSYVAVTYV